jgi:hypothetical protein
LNPTQASEHLRLPDLPTEFHKNLLIGSKVIRGTQRRTDRQDGDLTNLSNESRLKIQKICEIISRVLEGKLWFG